MPVSQHVFPIVNIPVGLVDDATGTVIFDNTFVEQPAYDKFSKHWNSLFPVYFVQTGVLFPIFPACFWVALDGFIAMVFR